MRIAAKQKKMRSQRYKADTTVRMAPEPEQAGSEHIEQCHNRGTPTCVS